jgi:glycerophosphoryl diester phosphodiesterase
MAAFKKARELGVPGIELDVHICASGELVVAHDDTFTRTAGDGRIIETLTLEEIRHIDVGSFFNAQIPGGPSFKGENPPLLEDVLEEFCPDMYIDIELKTRKIRDDPLPGRAAAIIRSLRERSARGVTVSSFNPISLMAFKKLCPQVPTAVIWSTHREVPPPFRYGLGRFIAHCDYVKPIHFQVNRWSRFKMAVLEGRPLVPWTIDDPILAGKMLKNGCEGIITNRPQDMSFQRSSPDAP